MHSPEFDPRLLELAMSLHATSKAEINKYCALVVGRRGTGKTHMLATAPRPLLIDSFDPNGTNIAALKPGIEDGSILIRRFERDEWKNPHAIREWTNMFDEHGALGLYDRIKTYAIDSMTPFSRYVLWEIIGKTGGLPDHTPSWPDYKRMKYTMLNVINKLMDLPCNVIMTGHIWVGRDESTQEPVSGVLLPPSMADEIPNAFTELWITRIVGGGTKREYKLQMKNDGRFTATTRMGMDCFDTLEEPNIRELLKKAKMPSENGDKLIQTKE